MNFSDIGLLFVSSTTSRSFLLAFSIMCIASCLHQVEAAKKNYHAACKEEKLASIREANGKADPNTAADQQKKLTEKVDKCKQDSQKVRASARWIHPPAILALNALDI